MSSTRTLLLLVISIRKPLPIGWESSHPSLGKKGLANERTHFERKFSRWSLNSRLDKSAALEEHVRDVLNQTCDHAAAIREIGQGFKCWVQLVGYFHNDCPAFGLDRGLIAGLALLNIGIDCDFYYLYSHEREDSE
jgi:Domain of unknown function (DUF4279)